MYKLGGCQVSHAICDLTSHLQHLRQAEWLHILVRLHCVNNMHDKMYHSCQFRGFPAQLPTGIV